MYAYIHTYKHTSKCVCADIPLHGLTIHACVFHYHYIHMCTILACAFCCITTYICVHMSVLVVPQRSVQIRMFKIYTQRHACIHRLDTHVCVQVQMHKYTHNVIYTCAGRQTERKILVCDLQGELVEKEGKYVYRFTDPANHYKSDSGRVRVFGEYTYVYT
jgi:hypothetical protein